jgi:hypothetical protein
MNTTNINANPPSTLAAGSAPAVNEANEFRLLAHELIRRLYVAAERPHLRLLRDHCDRALEELDAKDKAQNH